MFLMGLRPFTSDGIIMESYLLHSEFRLAGLDLYPSTLATTNERLEQLVQLLNCIRASANVIAVDRKFMPQSLEIAFRVSQAISILIQQTFPESAILIKVDVIIQRL
jgi:hypothetical protein